MRKLIFTLACMGAMSAQAQKLYLRAVENDVDRYDYRYNDLEKLDSVWFNDPEGFHHYDLWEYDEQGRQIRTTGHDLLDPLYGKYSWTSYVDYQYDDKGDMVMRENFNNFGDGFMQGGELTYLYDNQHRLTEVVYKMNRYGTEEKNPFQHDYYTYDDLGHLTSKYIERCDPFEPSDMWPSYRIEYIYDETTGLLLSQTVINMEDQIGEAVSEKTEYEYDAAGNVLQAAYYSVNSIGQYVKQATDEYVYDLNTSASNLIFPVDLEHQDFVHESAKNMITQKKYWGINMMSEEFELLATFNYTYSKAAYGSGVSASTIKGNGNNLKLAACDGCMLTLTGDNINNHMARIYDMNGKMVLQEMVNHSQVNVISLSRGLYIVKVCGQAMKFRK